MMKRYFTILLAALLTLSLGAQMRVTIPFRAAWIASVAGIDWPAPGSRGNTIQQMEDLCGILDSLSEMGLNTIILQVRPTADALYKSELSPSRIG